MDRSKHQITFFGDSYKTDSAVRGNQFAKSTEALVQSRIVEDVENVYVDQNMTMDSCIDAAITTGTIKQFMHQKESASVNVFRCFSVVTHPTFCTVNVTGYLESLREAETFTGLVVKMKTLALAMSIKKDDKRYTDSVISFLKRFDNIMTNVVNDFLRNNLLLSIKIDSFTDDASELGNYLFNRFGINYGSAFTQFESEIIDTVLEGVDPELAIELMHDFNLPDGMFYGLMPINHSLTFVCMNDKELGYTLDDKPVVIDPETAPSLYQIASSLVNHKKQLGVNTMYDMLITADGVRYKMYRNYLKGSEYLLDRA